jgi:hypothetical protein
MTFGDLLIGVCIFVLFGLVVEFVLPIWTGNSNSDAEARKPSACPEVSLAKVSDVWAERKPLAATCSEGEGAKSTIVRMPDLKFGHAEISEFYREIEQGWGPFKYPDREIIQNLLQILDKLGDCSSIVNDGLPIEHETFILNNFYYNLLAKVPLWQHSLSVAMRMAPTDRSDGFLAPTYIIIALAHDLGKIPEYREKYYVTGDHPILSTLVLNGIPEYRALPLKGDVDYAIKHHHIPNPKELFTKRLKKIDGVVREDEIAVQFNLFHQKKISLVEEHDYSGKMENDPKWGKQLYEYPYAANRNVEYDHPLGFRPKDDSTGYKPKLVEISEWFDPVAVMKVLRNSINRVENKRWDAVSMNDGLVYFNQDAVYRALMTVSPRNPYLMASQANESEKRNILYTVVLELNRTYGAIASELLDDGYYMCPVKVITGTGKALSSRDSPIYLIPFKADGFGVLPSDLEKEKSVTNKKMVKSITPLLGDAGDGHFS